MARSSRQVMVGTVPVGGGAPVSIQTMAKADPSNIDGIVDQLVLARKAGCDIARIAIPDMAAAQSIGTIIERAGLPVVADVHFDYRLAVAAAQAGASGLRVNPGNLGGEAALHAVVEAAQAAGIPIRVGVNAGSLPKDRGQPVAASAEAMVKAALSMLAPIQAMGFSDCKVSLKAFDLPTTVEANRAFRKHSDLPLHLGITEAGPALSGAVRSAAALSVLLYQGIGDTIRISLSAAPEVEVRVARVLLRALGLRRGGVVVSCPTCGRTESPVFELAEEVERRMQELGIDRVVAVMGCEVNGPGEARMADLGVAFGPRGEGLLFEGGQVIEKCKNAHLADALLSRLQAMAAQETGEEPHGQ